MNGDRVFGLPGLLSSISLSSSVKESILQLWGPKGLRRYIRNSFKDVNAMLNMCYTVHELLRDETEIETEEEDLHPKEILGRNIFPSPSNRGEGRVWNLFENTLHSVVCGELEHRKELLCVGYVFTEKDHLGSINREKLELYGFEPGPVCKRFKEGEECVNSSGVTITPEMVLDFGQKGRKIVILGDTKNSDSLKEVAQDCDILVHECTHSDNLKEKAELFGHSTPTIAGRFANIVGAATLVLTHFSARYRTEA